MESNYRTLALPTTWDSNGGAEHGLAVGNILLVSASASAGKVLSKEVRITEVEPGRFFAFEPDGPAVAHISAPDEFRLPPRSPAASRRTHVDDRPETARRVAKLARIPCPRKTCPRWRRAVGILTFMEAAQRGRCRGRGADDLGHADAAEARADVVTDGNMPGKILSNAPDAREGSLPCRRWWNDRAERPDHRRGARCCCARARSPRSN
jgi:aspartyl-tRNA(Asn)/glutamyl-tRNA(Gln) amidotransferase subunit C